MKVDQVVQLTLLGLLPGSIATWDLNMFVLGFLDASSALGKVVIVDCVDAGHEIGGPRDDCFTRLVYGILEDDGPSTSEQRYAVAFYYGLRNTLVAKDLEQATAVAYHGNKCMWRVVTKTGELIDTSGTMSGGGGRVRRGAMKAAAPGSKRESTRTMVLSLNQGAMQPQAPVHEARCNATSATAAMPGTAADAPHALPIPRSRELCKASQVLQAKHY